MSNTKKVLTFEQSTTADIITTVDITEIPNVDVIKINQLVQEYTRFFMSALTVKLELKQHTDTNKDNRNEFKYNLIGGNRMIADIKC